nr:uncharacterized protein LOC111747845 isoform X2 [Loxodonta africana]
MVSSGRLPAGGTPVLSGASARRAALCTESRRGRSPAWAEADGRRVWQGRGRRSLRPGKPGRPAPRPPIPGAAQPRGRRGDRAKPRELGKVAVAPRSVEHRSSVPP